jgi:hypothetical protein
MAHLVGNQRLRALDDGTGITTWIPDAGTASTALSGITAGTATNTINSTNLELDHALDPDRADD